jgi:uncharacterized protein YciI
VNSETAPRTAEPPSEFDSYELAILLRPRSRTEIDEEAAELLQAQHLGHLAAMKDAGYLKVAGPLTKQPEETWRGICVYKVGSIEEVRRLAEADPAVRAGQLAVEVMGWLTAKGSFSFP